MERFEDYVPHEISRGKPTKAQGAILKSMAAGAVLARHFDVCGGYWWTLNQSGNERAVMRQTVQSLLNIGKIAFGENVSVYSGRQKMPYVLAEPPKPE